ncbi:hypothetical protein ACFLXE_00280 [Chloroflexota bacterium]
MAIVPDVLPEQTKWVGRYDGRPAQSRASLGCGRWGGVRESDDSDGFLCE